MAELYVYMNGYAVGSYIQRRGGNQEFHYHDAWLDEPQAVPLSLSLPLTEKEHKGAVVYNYFDNLLPDSLDIRNRIQAQFGATTNQAFDLLAHIGADCVGAIQLLPEPSDVDIKKISASSLSENDIASILRNYNQYPLGMSRDSEFRISLAGVQEKVALLWHRKKWQRPRGATPTSHIFKLPIGKIEHAGIDLSNSVENEWLCLEVLRRYGLPVPEARIETFEDVTVLVVKRFDRKLAEDKKWIIRLPQEDMCQAMGIASALKYESDNGPGISHIMGLLQSSMYPAEDRKQFMKTVFLYWLLAAIDGHAKNFSVFLKQRGRFSLAPLYDVVSAFPLTDSRQLELKKIKMAMALRGKNTHYYWNEIAGRHWLSEAKRVHFPDSEMKKIMEEVADKLSSVIDEIQATLPKKFPGNIASPIFEGMKKTRGRLALRDIF